MHLEFQIVMEPLVEREAVRTRARDAQSEALCRCKMTHLAVGCAHAPIVGLHFACDALHRREGQSACGGGSCDALFGHVSCHIVVI